ncbi:MAG: uracil-DNA glycosylase [Gemmatimonadaceae bacterium]
MTTRRSLRTLLDSHCARLGGCRKCAHADESVVPILSEARSPRVMLVGQAPGKVELHVKRPFAGRAGATLFKWLARAGIDEQNARESIYISAITRCYPGPSPSGRGDRVPSPRERLQCGHWLDEELRLIRPELIIPVGKLAIERFLGTLPLEKVVGRVHERFDGNTSARVIPLPHPSGASSWPNVPANRVLLDAAIDLLRAELKRLCVGKNMNQSRRTA